MSETAVREEEEPAAVAKRPAGDGGGARRRVVTRTPVLVTVLVVALVLAGWACFAWWDAAHGARARIAADRDGLLEASAQELVNFHTLDYHNADAGLDGWERSATGPFLDELRKSRARDAQAIRDSRTRTEGKTVSQAVLGIDQAAGKGRVIAVVEIVVTPDQGQPTTKRDRVQVDLQRTESGWKLAALASVPMGA